MNETLQLINPVPLRYVDRPGLLPVVRKPTPQNDWKPYLIALNLTKRCNLRCSHCYLDATTRASGATDELTTQEVYRLLDQMAVVNKHAIVVITGGEPLTRPDILDIARYAVTLGFMVVFGTNGMLIDDATLSAGYPARGRARWPASRPASATGSSSRSTSASRR